jgi:hypothetical protein
MMEEESKNEERPKLRVCGDMARGDGCCEGGVWWSSCCMVLVTEVVLLSVVRWRGSLKDEARIEPCPVVLGTNDSNDPDDSDIVDPETELPIPSPPSSSLPNSPGTIPPSTCAKTPSNSLNSSSFNSTPENLALSYLVKNSSPNAGGWIKLRLVRWFMYSCRDMVEGRWRRERACDEGRSGVVEVVVGLWVSEGGARETAFASMR